MDRPPATCPGPTRQAMTCYWKWYRPTLQSMMLDSNAEWLTLEEQREILSYLPDLSGKRVLELGAGIGRFTGVLAERARWVTAVDFMPEFVAKNKDANGHCANIDFVQADVTRLERAADSCDVVFTNWLLMYLDDDEVNRLVDKLSSWLTEGGLLFVRESCFHSTGQGVDRPPDNPTFYRDPTFYSTALQATANFRLLRATSVRTYIKFKNNPNQMCYLLKKVPAKAADERRQSFQQFLDQNQYSRRGILMYESIFGDNFVSTGGLATTEEFCLRLELRPGDRVLDVGCGIGGSAFHMAKTFGASVTAIDLSSNMISIALQRQMTALSSNKVAFEICDVTTCDYPAESFDVVYSRDTLLHIPNKASVFAKILVWLRPGGRLLVSDYCRGDRPQLSDGFLDYVASRHYHLLTVAEYGKLLEDVGFRDVRAEDRTKQFIDILRIELDRFAGNRETFMESFGAADYEHLAQGWRSKMVRCGDGDQAWGLLTATK